MHTSRLTSPSSRGSALLLVVILTFTVSILVGSVLQFSVEENRLNRRMAMWMESKNASEAVAEFGFAELVHRFDSKNSFPEDALMPNTSGNPLIIPTDFYYNYNWNWGHSRTYIVMPESPYNPALDWNTRGTEIIGGIVPAGEWMFIDPNIPANEEDKLKGRKVFVRGVRVYSKATVRDWATGATQTAYTSQELQVRDAPLFAHAIFYNMDMEIAPGAPMTITGPVHVNGKMYIQSNAGLAFNSQVTSSGTLHYGRHPDSGQSSASGAVTFKNGTGTAVSMHDGTQWLQSSVSNFRDIALSRWHGNVLTSDHHVQKQNILEIDDYVADDPATTSVADDQLNHGYHVISKVKANSDATYNDVIEKNKFAYKAGMTIRVDPGSLTYQIVTYERDADGEVVYDAGTGLPTEIILDDSADPIATIESFASTGTSPEIVTTGMRDKRRSNQGLETIDVDIGKLRTLVHANDETNWGGTTEQKPENWWNGIVYVELPTTGAPGSDGIDPGINGWGVKLVNGQQIPNPSFAHADGVYGMTFATNNVLYVQGHFNADGNSATGSATEPDTGDEPPAALAGDAIMLLSSNWNDANSAKNQSDRVAAYTEISAAILAGLVPSGEGTGNSYSGGVENFPRFLETWDSSRTIRIRGSIVSLYESEIATEKWGQSGVYSAPSRDWGFHSKFAEGYYPPGTPNTRTYRRIDFKDMTGAEFAAAVEELKSYL